MYEFLFVVGVTIFIPTWVLFAIGVINFMRAENHTMEYGKRQFSTVDRLLGGVGYNAQGMRHHEVSIKYFKMARVGVGFYILTFLLIIYIGK